MRPGSGPSASPGIVRASIVPPSGTAGTHHAPQTLAACQEVDRYCNHAIRSRRRAGIGAGPDHRHSRGRPRVPRLDDDHAARPRHRHPEVHRLPSRRRSRAAAIPHAGRGWRGDRAPAVRARRTREHPASPQRRCASGAGGAVQRDRRASQRRCAGGARHALGDLGARSAAARTVTGRSPGAVGHDGARQGRARIHGGRIGAARHHDRTRPQRPPDATSGSSPACVPAPSRSTDARRSPE